MTKLSETRLRRAKDQIAKAKDRITSLREFPLSSTDFFLIEPDPSGDDQVIARLNSDSTFLQDIQMELIEAIHHLRCTMDALAFEAVPAQALTSHFGGEEKEISMPFTSSRTLNTRPGDNKYLHFLEDYHPKRLSLLRSLSLTHENDDHPLVALRNADNICKHRNFLSVIPQASVQPPSLIVDFRRDFYYTNTLEDIDDGIVYRGPESDLGRFSKYVIFEWYVPKDFHLKHKGTHAGAIPTIEGWVTSVVAFREDWLDAV